MPMGLTLAPTHFQFVVESVLHGAQGLPSPAQSRLPRLHSCLWGDLGANARGYD